MSVTGTAAGTALGRQGLASRIAALEFRNELAVLLAIVVAIQAFPGTPPLGVYVLGVVDAAPLALNAVAVLLVYRASRFPNFAQIALAWFSGLLFSSLVQGQFFLALTRSMCGCVSRSPAGASVAVNFVLAAVVAIAVAGLLTGAFYATVLRRFGRAPRLMLALFSIFTAEALSRLARDARGALVPEGIGDLPTTSPPWDFEWVVDGFARLHLREVLLVVLAVAALIGVARFLRTSDTGIAVRASSESPDRASMLGVDVVAVTSRVWILAGLLGGIAGVVGAFGGSGETNSGSAEQLVILLLVAAFARFRSIGMAAVASLVIGVLVVVVPYSFDSAAPLHASLAFLVGGVLLVQRSRRSRAERADASSFELTREARPVPAELRGLPQVRAWARNGTIAATVCVLALPWVLSEVRTADFSRYVIFVLFGLSLLIVTGWMGQVSLGQFGFAAIGAWAAAVSGLPMPLAVLAGGCLGAVAAVVVGLPALRLTGLNLAVATLAFAVSANTLFVGDRYLGKLLPMAVERPRMLGMEFDDPRVFYYTMVAVVAAAALAVRALRRSRTGRTLIAVRANEAAGQSFGVDVVRLRLTALGVSGFLAGVAGALLAYQVGSVSPSSFTADRSIEVFMYSLVGGMVGIAGAVLGFVFMAVVTFFRTNALLAYLGAGVGGMLVLMAAPGGLAELLYGVRDAALRRLATRLRIPVPSLMGDRAETQAAGRAPLDESTRPPHAGLAAALRYRLPHQWALDRFAEGATHRAASGAPTGMGER